MSNPTYTRLNESAIRLINVFGREMELLTQTQGGDAWNPVTTETAQDIVGIVTNYQSNEIDGEQIRSDDFKVILSSTIEPDLTMRLRTNGRDYSIVNIMETKPADVAILYTLQVRL